MSNSSREPLSIADSDRMERAAEVILRAIAVNRVLKDALKRIAVGDGYYGAQAAEYKAIARAALSAVEPTRALDTGKLS